MKYLKNLTSFLTKKKEPKSMLPPKRENMHFDVDEVLESIDDSLAYLKDAFTIESSNVYVNKFEIIISKIGRTMEEKNFTIDEVREQVLFMLDVIKSTYFPNEIIIYYEDEYEYTDLKYGLYSSGKMSTDRSYQDFAKMNNRDIAKLHIGFYLS